MNMILLEFMEVYHVFPRMPGDNYGRQLMSRSVIVSLVTRVTSVEHSYTPCLPGSPASPPPPPPPHPPIPPKQPFFFLNGVLHIVLNCKSYFLLLVL